MKAINIAMDTNYTGEEIDQKLKESHFTCRDITNSKDEYRLWDKQFAKVVIDEAIKAGVRHISYSSLTFASNSNLMSVMQVMAAHLLTEQYLDQVQQKNPTTFSYTAVREGLYSESYPIYTAFFDINNPPQVRSESPTMALVLASHGPSNLSEVTACLIIWYIEDPTSFPWLNKIIILSGPCAYTLSEMADIFSCILSKLIKIVEIT